MARRPLSLLLILPVLLLEMRAGDEVAPEPTNFGIKENRSHRLPLDPRDYRHGRFKNFPDWQVSRELPNDVFTFARLRHSGDWATDYPDSELNFSLRLQQLTSIQVNPNSAVVDIDAEQLRHYPFIYMIEPGDMQLTNEQAAILRTYLLNGGFMMVDDFWGTAAWNNFHAALKQIFPEREAEDLPLEHPVFHAVFPLKVKPQIPSVEHAIKGRERGITFETDKPGSEEVHYRGVFDDRRRMMIMICHNTDLGDGWEEEGTDPWYFRQFSEKYAYPLGINIIYHALTH